MPRCTTLGTRVSPCPRAHTSRLTDFEWNVARDYLVVLASSESHFCTSAPGSLSAKLPASLGQGLYEEGKWPNVKDRCMRRIPRGKNRRTTIWSHAELDVTGGWASGGERKVRCGGCRALFFVMLLSSVLPDRFGHACWKSIGRKKLGEVIQILVADTFLSSEVVLYSDTEFGL